MFGARTNKKKNSSDQKKNRWASQNVCNDSLSNNQCDKGVMKVPPEISCMSAVRAHYGGVISCNISGRPKSSIQRDRPRSLDLRALFKGILRM